MALEDLSMFRSIPGSTVFYPSDGVSCERAVELAANTPGVCFIRTSRPNIATIYENDEKFEIGKAKVSMGDFSRKHVFRVSITKVLKFWIMSEQRTTKPLIRLHGSQQKK